VVSSPQPVGLPSPIALLLLCSQELLVASEAYVPAGTSGPTLSTYLLCSRMMLARFGTSACLDGSNNSREHSRYVLEVPTMDASGRRLASGQPRTAASGIPPRARPRYIRKASPRSERAARFFHIHRTGAPSVPGRDPLPRR
jgi:hypothetical protein